MPTELNQSIINNILITSAGRRVSLVKNFQQTIKKFNKNSLVFTTDVNPKLSSASQVADGFLEVPLVTDSKYLSILKKYCIDNDISVIIPTIDTELIILAKAKKDFLDIGIFIAISSPLFCDIFYLKDSTERFFLNNSFDTPISIKNLEHCNYPIFAKLNNSSCSIGATIVDTQEELKKLAINKNYIFQEFIKGDEFTVDVFIDKNNNPISIIPRQRLEVRAGEVSKSKAVKDKKIIDIVKKLCNKLDGAYGCITIQLFKTKDKIVFIEINPRFGGGYPLSLNAGADFAEYLIKDYLNYKMEYNEKWRDNTLMLRYDAEIIINE